MPWHNIYMGGDEGTRTQMWSHSHWKILTDPFHHASRASLSLHHYHSSATCLCLPAHLTQTKHPSHLHTVSPTACPALLGACHEPQLHGGCSSENHCPGNSEASLQAQAPQQQRLDTKRAPHTPLTQTGTGTSSPTETVPGTAWSCTGQGSTT